jgi:hypothetical protein
MTQTPTPLAGFVSIADVTAILNDKHARAHKRVLSVVAKSEGAMAQAIATGNAQAVGAIAANIAYVQGRAREACDGYNKLLPLLVAASEGASIPDTVPDEWDTGEIPAVTDEAATPDPDEG